MKHLFKFFLLSLFIFSLFSCKKTTNIAYPANITYGTNILAFNDASHLTPGKIYGMGAKLDPAAKLKIVVTNLSTNTNTVYPKPNWTIGDITGWTVGTYDASTNSQVFTAPQTDKVDVSMIFNVDGAQLGNIKVEFYENSDKITLTKSYFWHY